MDDISSPTSLPRITNPTIVQKHWNLSAKPTMPNSDATNKIILSAMEDQKNKAPAAKKPAWTKLIAYVKKHDLLTGTTVFTFGKEVGVAGPNELGQVLRDHNKGKEPKDWEYPVSFVCFPWPWILLCVSNARFRYRAIPTSLLGARMTILGPLRAGRCL